MAEEKKQTSSIPPGIAGLLSYFVPFAGGLIFLVLEKENRLIRFHAVQSILLWTVFIVLSIVLLWIPVINVLVGIVMLLIWIFMMYQALMERMFELPLIGDYARRQAFGPDESTDKKEEEKRSAGDDEAPE